MSILKPTAYGSDPALLAAQTPAQNERYVRAVHDRGLAFDLGTMSRRRVLALGGSFALLATFAGTRADAAVLDPVPEETAGPYPADGSNGIDVRVEEGIVRSDITSSFGSSTTVAEGVPTTISLTCLDTETGEPLVGAAVYLWHCDQEGRYSLYSQGVTQENYLRGIQETDSSGTVTFASIFPACYSGRWPHVHFEVYASLEDATSGSDRALVTSQIAIPEDVCDTVFGAVDGYATSVRNLSQVSLATDNVFADDEGESQLATVSGSVSGGYALELTIGVETGGVTIGSGEVASSSGGSSSDDSVSTSASSPASSASGGSSARGSSGGSSSGGTPGGGSTTSADDSGPSAPVIVGGAGVGAGLAGAAAWAWARRDRPAAPTADDATDGAGDDGPGGEAR